MTHPRSLFAFVSLAGLPLAGCAQCGAPSQNRDTPTSTGSAPRSAATPAVPAPVEEPTEEATNAFAKAANAFGVDLYARWANGSNNLVFSPASLAVALTMTWAGARGDTAAQMASVLHLPASAEDTHRAASALLREWNAPHREGLELRAANRLFLDRTVKLVPSFSNTMSRYYGAGLERLDIQSHPEAARIRINEWVKAETRHKILELIPGGGAGHLSRLVLTNAVYFLGRWARRFERESTTQQPFHLATGGSVGVPTMHRQDVFRYGRLSDAQVLELGYQGGGMAMLIVLPDARDGLPALERGLSTVSISRFSSRLGKQEVKVFLPRFRIDPPQALRCKPALWSLGMVLAFDNGDFTAMAEREHPLLIDDVYHKSFLQVDEAGTEAAAATAVVMHSPSAQLPPPIPEFRADHPFLFFVRDANSGAILFMGRVEDPSRR
ncbi:MAG: serpin family protein [Polyangiaceae bacterium]|nr:serpin family protein [Polyangiaceae bacterium]